MITNGYTSLADIKTLLAIDSVDVPDDTVIERMVESASRFFDGATWRRFYTTAADETRYFKALNGERCYTDDIVSITSVAIDQDGDRTYETTLATTDYDTKPDNTSLTSEPITWLEMSPNGNYSFTTQSKGVKIVGKFGFAAAAPADVKMTIEEIVINTYKKRFGVNTTGAATITGAGVVITPKDIPDTAMRCIDKYKRLF
jgi:hypothetical protein